MVQNVGALSKLKPIWPYSEILKVISSHKLLTHQVCLSSEGGLTDWTASSIVVRGCEPAVEVSTVSWDPEPQWEKI